MVLQPGDDITLCTCINLETCFLVIHKDCYFPIRHFIGATLYHANEEIIRGVRTVMLCNTVNFLEVFCNSTTSTNFSKMVFSTTVVTFNTLYRTRLVTVVLIFTFITLRFGVITLTLMSFLDGKDFLTWYFTSSSGTEGF